MSKVGIGTRLLLSTAVSIGAASALSSEAGAADILSKAPTQQQAADSGGPASAMWVGGDFKQNVAAGYGGGVFALNGNLDKPGWLLRGDLVGVGFDFAMPPAPNGRGDFFRGDGAIGYQVIGYGLVAQGFVGADYENYDFHPASAGNPQLKDRAGAIFFGRVASATATQFPFAIDGLFETANSDFWVRGRTELEVWQLDGRPGSHHPRQRRFRRSPFRRLRDVRPQRETCPCRPTWATPTASATTIRGAAAAAFMAA